MKTLDTSVEIVIRFSETDAMGVVWHGNYLKYFEDGREAFGVKYGMKYLDVFNAGFYTPIVNSTIDHKAPVYYGQKIRIKVELLYKSAAKIIFNYEITNLNTGEIAATGTTTQVFLIVETRTLSLTKPGVYVAWEDQQNWQVNE